MIKPNIIPTVLLFISCHLAMAQRVDVPFDSDQWELKNATTVLEEYQGKMSLKLSAGVIHLPEVDFRNGTIEVDVNFPDQRNFFGIIFRAQDAQNYEHFYLRPHQSGKPDACQYTPQFNGFSCWQLYHGEGFGSIIDLVPDQWHHLKIVIRGDQAEVFYDNMEQPVLKMPDLVADYSEGFIGLNSGQPVHFANFSYQADNTTFPKAVAATVTDPSLVSSWELSGPLPNDLFPKLTAIDGKVQDQLKWDKYPTESNGLLNIARYVAAAENKSTVAARLVVNAEGDEIKGLAFGYSDEVMVFVNGKLQYAGQNNYRSRDYRYLGTIGFFDAVFLDLQAGRNEILFVVKENFGGWGLQAKWM